MAGQTPQELRNILTMPHVVAYQTLLALWNFLSMPHRSVCNAGQYTRIKCVQAWLKGLCVSKRKISGQAKQMKKSVKKILEKRKHNTVKLLYSSLMPLNACPTIPWWTMTCLSWHALSGIREDYRGFTVLRFLTFNNFFTLFLICFCLAADFTLGHT